MTRAQLSEASRAENRLQCEDCRTLAPAASPYCESCGGHLRPRKKSRFAYDAIATFIGVAVVILYWIERG